MAAPTPKKQPNVATNAFDKLLPFMWRGKHYPLTRIHVSLAHDLVEHKFWGVDGARIEDTGLGPVRIEASIPIANTIYPAASEKWTAGTLYPDALRAFVLDFGKRLAGPLQHPEFGEFAVKPERLDFELTGDKRGSTEIRASWLEALPNSGDTSSLFPSPKDQLQAAASDLEAQRTALLALAPQLPTFQDDLDSLGRRIAAISDSVFVLSYRTAGIINRVLYQANRLEASLLRAKSALTHPAITNCRIIQAAAYELRTKLLSPAGIGLYNVPSQTTLPMLTSVIADAKIADLVKLNPNLMRSPVIPKGTKVRYLTRS